MPKLEKNEKINNKSGFEFTEFYLVLTGFYLVLPSLTGFYRVLLGFT